MTKIFAKAAFIAVAMTIPVHAAAKRRSKASGPTRIAA